MKHWQETSRILGELVALAERGRDAALATVISTQGSSYRRPGAKMLIADDGEIDGSVSGGCLDADVREVALSVIGSGVAQLRHYDTGSDDATPFGLGLGCGGTIDIFVQRATTPEELEAARCILPLLLGDAAFAISTIVRGTSGLGRSIIVEDRGQATGSFGEANLDRVIVAHAGDLIDAGVSRLEEVDGHQLFTEVLLPPPSLVVLGAGDDTRPLAACATDVGFRVTVVDHRSAHLRADHYPPATRLVEGRPDSQLSDLPLGAQTYAIVKMHSLALDRAWVKRLLSTPVPYIGLLGPHARAEEVLSELGADDNDRVFSPVGLNIGGYGAEQVAVSIVAEMLAVMSGREPTHLRARVGAIQAT